MFLPRSAILAVALLLPVVAAGAYAAGTHESASQPTRTMLAQAVDPTGARGRTLGLSRVTIPAHTRLGLHRHPGVQIAVRPEGHTHLHGEDWNREGLSRRGGPEPARRAAGRRGKNGKVHAGEWVIERPRDVHFGANEGGRPVLILLATLFKNGSPPSIPVAE